MMYPREVCYMINSFVVLYCFILQLTCPLHFCTWGKVYYSLFNMEILVIVSGLFIVDLGSVLVNSFLQVCEQIVTSPVWPIWVIIVNSWNLYLWRCFSFVKTLKGLQRRRMAIVKMLLPATSLAINISVWCRVCHNLSCQVFFLFSSPRRSFRACGYSIDGKYTFV